ncbi:MAG: polyprenol monophosphomannose synthase [Flavobacteriaceae bacterium]
MRDILVVIPTYNEIENIEAIIRATISAVPEIDILIVDDNSPDYTANKVKQLQEEFPENLFLLERAGKQGLGTAYIAGFKWALQHEYKYICEMDADFSHNPNDLKRLYAECKFGCADLAIGSRYKSGVNVVNWPMNRVLLSYFASRYVQFITRMGINDATAGFICYKRKVLEAINFDKIQFVGYAFQIEMKFKAYLEGFKIEEVPVIFTDRTKGVSKMDGSIISEAVFGVILMKLKSLLSK